MGRSGHTEHPALLRGAGGLACCVPRWVSVPACLVLAILRASAVWLSASESAVAAVCQLGGLLAGWQAHRQRQLGQVRSGVGPVHGLAAAGARGPQ